MFENYKNSLREHPKFTQIRFLWRTFRHPLVGILGYIYGSYLTLRYVDTYSKFPAIIFQDGLLRLYIHKKKRAKFSIADRLIVQPLGVTRVPCLIQLDEYAEISINGEFTIGNNVRIVSSRAAIIEIGGKLNESASGISGNCLVKAYKKVSIGRDVIIAWDTFITDSDWHLIGSASHHEDTVIDDHVWIAAGVKILKGAVIGKDSVIGCSAVISSGKYPIKSLLVGVPAKVVKSPIPEWKRDLPISRDAL
jgi:acetyltransferase-like isoleucine patch superfamily enzyme